jgi:fructose-1,6-bisphosphatase I
MRDFLQPGTAQVAAGYCIYGPSTMLVLTVGHGTHAFTLDREVGSFVLTVRGMRIPEETKEFAVNMSNQRHWEPPMQAYVGDLLAGIGRPARQGLQHALGGQHGRRRAPHPHPRRHLQLPAGPQVRGQGRPLRLMYEANPMSFLVEQAGGAASTGRQRMLEVQPTGLHMRVPVFLGSKAEVEAAVGYHAARR